MNIHKRLIRRLQIIILATILILPCYSLSAKDIWTKNQIVQSLVSEVTGEHLELLWSISAWIWNNQEMIATIHGNDRRGEHVASIYRKIDGGFELLKRLGSGNSYFLQPVFFRTKRAGIISEREYLLALSEIYTGTANIRVENIFVIKFDASIQEVEVQSAINTYKEHLNKGEGIWKGEQNSFSDDSMPFSFNIWKESDPECCPSGGNVTGRYELTLEAGKYRMHAVDFHRQYTVIQRAPITD